MIWMFLITNLFLLVYIFISIYVISYYKKQKNEFAIYFFRLGLKSYLFLIFAGVVLSAVNNFIFDFGFFKDSSHFEKTDVPILVLYVAITGVVIGFSTLIYSVILSNTPYYEGENTKRKRALLV